MVNTHKTKFPEKTSINIKTKNNVIHGTLFDVIKSTKIQCKAAKYQI